MVVPVTLSVVLVAAGMLLNPLPLSTCHCTVGVGLPLAAAVNVTLAPVHTVWLLGSVVTNGAVQIV